MPVTSTRRISTSSTTGLPPFSGSSLSSTSYSRRTALSPSRFTSSSSNSTSGLGVGYYRSLSSSSNYLSNRSSIAGYPSNESSYVSSRYSNKSTSSGAGDSGLGTSSERSRGSGLLGSRASIARSVALSGADLYAKYSPANYVPNSGDLSLSRSRSLTDTNRATNTNYPSSSHATNNNNTTTKKPEGSSDGSIARRKVGGLSSNPSVVVSGSSRRYGGSSQDEAEGDENNNSGAGSSVRRRRAKVALGGAGSALDSVDGEIKVTEPEEAILGNTKYNTSDHNPTLLVAPDDNHPAQPSALLTCMDNVDNTTNQERVQQPRKSNSNVTKITINHSTANGTSIILNNSHCTSRNRAIVHIFDEPAEKKKDHSLKLDDHRNNNGGSINDRGHLNGEGARLIKVDIKPAAAQERDRSKSNGNGNRMLLRQGLSNAGGVKATTNGDRSSYKSTGVKLKRDPEIFLRNECDLVRNELMQKKIAEHNSGDLEERAEIHARDRSAAMSNGISNGGVGNRTIKLIVGGESNPPAVAKSRMENGTGGSPSSSSVAYRNGRSSPMDTSDDFVQMNGNGRLRNKPGSMSSHSSNSSSASSLMDTGSRGSNLEDIKFIDSDENNEASPSSSSIGAALNGASSRISKLNRTLASTLDSLKASTPIVGASINKYSITNGHHTLPHNSSSGVGSLNGFKGTGRLNNGSSSSDYSKKYSTLSSLPSRAAGVIRNGLLPSASNGGGGLFEERPLKLYSKDAQIMGLVAKEEEEAVDNHQDESMMVTTSEPPNDKIAGKSWAVNGTNGSSSSNGLRTSSLRNALPPVSPVRTWERDRPRYRELLDAEPSTTSTSSSSTSLGSSSKYDAYDKGSADTVEGLCGLRNIGNTCFMNSVLQCLSHTHDLTKFVRGQREPKSVTKDQRIFAEYVKLIKDMWSAGTRTVTPMELKSAVSSKHRMYSGCGQQDAQEFLRFFLEALHGACNEGTKQEGLTLDDNLSDGRRADLMWEWYSKTERSVIKDLFVGQLRSTLKCTVCGNTSVTFDPFWDLSVPLPPSSSRCKLENCLELFIREEVLDGDEMPTCSKCKVRRKSTKSFTIQRFPKYLVIHLKRFSETRWSKLTNVVEFPMGERELNLAPYASNNTAGSPHYSLYGISNHMGSTAGGHYVALCKHPKTKKWHEFNDNHVSDSSESSLISSSAYLLFYERA